ncbi:MAG TPA: hypothetical protein VF796_21050, partial [Humisphaera sp.]
GNTAGAGDAIAGLATVLAGVCLGRTKAEIPPPAILGPAELLKLSGRDKLATLRGRAAARYRQLLKHAQIRLGLKGDPYEKDRFSDDDVAAKVWRFTKLIAEHGERRKAG